MSRNRLVYLWSALLIACSGAELGGSVPTFDAGVVCEDRDHDGYGRNCARGYDCNDDDPKSTTECRSCSKPELGCACAAGEGPVACFLPDKSLPGGDVVCSEGTRFCRDGAWSACEAVHQYVVAPSPDTQRVVDPSAGQPTCSVCDLKCFKVVDNLLSDAGTAGGSVKFAPGGGLTLLPGDGGMSGGTTDSGTGSLTGCAAMAACCSTLSDSLKTACSATVAIGDNARCDQERVVFCPPGTVSGPVTGCTFGAGADTDCDGIPNVVDSLSGKPLATSNNQTIFHQLDIGETGQNSLDITFKLRNADVYFLLDMTNTMKEERDNLISSLTNGNVVNCAHLNQCCNRLNDAAKKAACQAAVKNYTNRAGQPDDQVSCLAEESNYCPGGMPLDCPDTNFDGQPDNALKEQGVVGATRCLVGSSWFGAGYTREIPIILDPEGCSGSGCGTVSYGDRDEFTFKHLVDMTSDYERVRTALSSMVTNGNHDEPEGGMMALYSAITGRGHYFGINRPAVPSRLNATGCPPDSFGYPCFRKSAIPIVVFFTDRPHHNGPDDPGHCVGQGAGCPYNHLTNGTTPGSWTSGAAESASDKQATRVPADAESFSTAYNAGDIRGQYLSLVGDTRFMIGDYPTAIVGCGADPAAPDALIRFKVGTPAGATGTVPPINVNFHLTKDDVYNASKYGTWNSSRTNDPSPATEFGSVVSVFRGTPTAVSSVIDVKDSNAVAIASGPDSTYLTYTGMTNGQASGPGFLGGISGCSADGSTNQVLFTFRPTANAHIVVDASESKFPAAVSLHQGLPSTLPKNPSMLDGSSQAIANTNDTFAAANAVPSTGTAIDGLYVERTGDSKVSTINADYTATTQRYTYAMRVNGSNQLTASTTDGLYVGMALASTASWSATPVVITNISGSTLTLSATWQGTSDMANVAIGFMDSLVGCGVDPAGKDAVFKFDVATPRRVRIDTEGSAFDTVISLHDAPPPTSVTKNDVSGNGSTPGYNIGDVNNASYTLSDVGSGTAAFGSSYDYQQCGADKTAPDAAFKFQLSKPTHLSLEVSSGSWNPIVALFGSQPGSATVLSNAANNNDRIGGSYSAFNMGDVYGQLDTRVSGSTLSSALDDYSASAVGCGAVSSGRDQIFSFTPSNTTTVRMEANPSGGWLPVVSVFDGPPPVGGVIGTTQLFDASTQAVPDSNCLVYSFRDPNLAGMPHLYAICPSKRYSDDASSRCASSGMTNLVGINSLQEQQFLAGQAQVQSSTANFHIGVIDSSGSGPFAWRDGAALTYTNWASGQPNGGGSKSCGDMTPSGTWQSGKCTSSSSNDNVYYICENNAPAVVPPEDTVSAYSLNPAGTVLNVTGSTRRMSSDYNGATLLTACGGTITAGDAVFKIVTGSGVSYTLNVDSAGSSFGAVLGLFDSTLDAAGYKTCDAAGGAPLTYTLLANRTYYVLLKGTAASPEGTYKLKFADSSALAASGSRLGCAAGTASVPKASVDVDVDANHTYYVVVDSATSAFGAYDLLAHALYRSRAEVANSVPSNETGSNAVALPDPYRSRVTVVDTSTAGMIADYGTGASAMCTTSAGAPDAVYRFTPSLSTDVKFTVAPKGTGLTSAAIGVFDGLPGTSAVLHDLTANGNANEALASAEIVPLTGAAQQYLGNTSAMAANVDPSVLSCGAYPNGHDAVFGFHLAATTTVEVDASASSVTDPVINLFRSSPLSKPTQVTLENDTKQNADTRPAPTPTATSSWLYYGADMTHLTAESQAQLSVAALNSETPASNQPQDLGDVLGKRVTVSGGDTSPMLADYPGNWSCGANDAAPDAIYKFYTSTNATVHVKATPAGSFDTVLAVYDGTNGLPLRLSDVSSVVEDNACVAPNAPKNLTNATLKAIAPQLASAPAANLNCGASVVSTTDPDGSGSAIAGYVNWCGTQPLTFVQPQTDGPELVVFVVSSLQIAAGSSLRVLGARPALFVVNGSVNIAGTLTTTPDDTNYPGMTGAGGDWACAASEGGNAAVSGVNTGGGAGGGFGTAGGVGGYGSSSTNSAGGVAGATRGNASLVPLLGGCSGGHAAVGSRVGLAGGAVQISATGTITVVSGTGSINAAGGAGVVGASGESGGSGGGSGGAILLHASTINYTSAQLSARGGAGGQGIGASTVNGGTGGPDASTAGTAGANSSTTAGGGGGGGGYGRVALVTGSVSLAPCTAATNENASSAWPITLDGSGRQYIERGNTSGMVADHGGICGTPNTSPDAVYAFTLSQAATVQIDGRASSSNTVLGLYTAGNLGQTPTPVLLENDTTSDADTRPAPTPDAVNNWLAYRGDLTNLTISSQPQISIDNQGNANEIIPTDLPDPINRRVTVLNANTSAMNADYLAASCSMPAADPARDAIYRFVPSQSGLVRVSANYSSTAFDPVIALYRGTHGVIDERVTLMNLGDTALAKLNADSTTIKVYNLARTQLYAGPSSSTPDYNVVVRDAKTPVGIVRTATSTIPNGATVSVDYTYDSGAPLPISQQVTTSVDLAALNNPNENASNAVQVPVRSGQAYSYSGNTTSMTADVDGSLFSCGPPALASNDATFDFSLDRSTTVSISTAGSAYNAAIALFDSPYTRPSSSVLRSPAAVEQRLYDVSNIPGAPESTCVNYEYNTHRYWLCSSKRPWSQAEGMCQAVGLHLVTIDDSFENAALFSQVQATGEAHHIGFQETVPYTASWGAWTSGGGGTTGSSVSGRFTRWALSEPNGLGDCLQMLSTGTWDDDDCSVQHGYVCELNNTASTPAVPSGSTCGAPLVYGGHTYRACTDTLDWASARARCTSVGMDLARVDDTAENDQLRVLLAGKAGWLGGNDSATEGQWVWADNSGFWLVTAYRNWFTGEPKAPTANPGSRMRSQDGAWEDTPITYQGARYICEDPAPGPISQPPTANAPQAVDVFSPGRQFRGSTANTTSSVGGFIGCGAGDGSAYDAVFALTLPYTTDLRVDVTGSFSGAVIGLFKDAIAPAPNYKSCAVGSGTGPQLVATGLLAGNYYVVITGTPGTSGAYRVTFDAQTTDSVAFAMENDTLADAIAHPLGSIDGQWLVKRADMSHLTPTLGNSRYVDMGAGTDINDQTAQVLDPVNGYQVQVLNASTGDLHADFPPGSCDKTANGPDAMYKFTPTVSENVSVRLTTSGWAGQVVLYDGSTGSPLDTGHLPSTPISLAPGYANETPLSAQLAPIGPAQAFLGNLTSMANDVASSAFNPSYNNAAGSPVPCNADLFGKDAFFKFNIPGPGTQKVEITSTGTSPAHTIALWDDKPFSKPSGTTVMYDDKVAAALSASTRLGNGDNIDDDWVVVRGDTTTLSPNLSTTNFTDPHDDTVHALGNIKGKQVVTVSASTSGLGNDYLASTLACGGGSDAPGDAIYSFSHSSGGRVRLSLNNPQPAFVPNLALFKGEPNTVVGVNVTEVSAGTSNEARSSAFAATSPAAGPKLYSGSTSGMANNYTGSTFTQGSAYGSHVCTPDAAGKDAFISFTLTSATNVELSSVSAGFDHTIALWDSTPITAPSATAMANDTRSAAYTNPIGAIDDTWVVKSTTMSTLFPDGLTASTPGVSSNNDVQNLGDPVGKRINVAGDTSLSTVNGDYANTTMSCGGPDSVNDIIYKFRPTASTTVRVATNNPSNPGFSTAIALFNGATGDPQRLSDAAGPLTTTYCTGGGWTYTPTNVSAATFSGINFASAPTVTLGCGGTVTFDSTGNTWTNWCAGQTKPTPVTVVQGSGNPDVVVLPFSAFTLSSGTTLSLVGTRPVAILAQGNVSIAGTLNVSASGTTAGAGGNQTCSGSTGSTSGSGGGGGNGTQGGDGGGSGLIFISPGGSGGATHGAATVSPLLAGCGGASGSSCSSNPGAGGGAIQISAGGTVTVASTGSIHADGGNAPGVGCGFLQNSSGAGGGSGGSILLEGASVTTTGALTANGGAGSSSSAGTGGGGGSSSSGSSGSAGGTNFLAGPAGGGGGGYGRIQKNNNPCKASNEAFGSAVVVPIGQTQTYTGPSAGMTSDLTGTSFKYAGACTPDTTGPDAFFKFTVTATTPFVVSSASTNYNHTITLFNNSQVSMACSDGAATTGTNITTSLSPGTYYVGIKSRNSGAGGTFTLAFTDTSSAGPWPSATACTTSNSLDAAVNANTDYYVVVKGAASGQVGTYNLTVTDIGAVTDFGCGTDLSAPDAYYEFDVNDTNGRKVTIALTEDATHLDGSFQLVRDEPPYNVVSGDTTFTCETSAQTYTLTPGKYYVAVRGTSIVSGAGNKPVEISIRDESGMNALDCADGTSTSAGTIQKVLQPGTYYAGITSRNSSAGGTYKLRLRDAAVNLGGNGTWLGCADNTSYTLDYTIPSGDHDVLHYVVVKGAAGGQQGTYTLTLADLDSVADTCDVGDSIQMDPTAPDAFYAFKVADTDADGRDVTVSLGMSGSSTLDGAYRLFHQNGTAVGGCHDRSGPFTYANLPADTYYLALRGKSAAQGLGKAPYELSINDQDAYGSLECKDAAAQSGSTITRTLQPGNYWVGIKSQAGATNPMDYSVQFRDFADPTPTNATEVGGACGSNVISAAVTAGKPYYVMVKGNTPTAAGPYSLSITDTTTNGGFGCHDDGAAGDAYFEFNVNDPNGRRVTIDTQNSALDTVIALFRAGQPIDSTHYDACDDDSGATTGSSKITRDLAPGVYYVVVRAKQGTPNAALPFELSVRDDSAVGSIACGATDVTGPAQIRSQLGPGTYHVVVKGMPGSDKGAYKLRIRDEGPYQNAASEVACNDAQNELLYNVTAGKPYYAVVKGAATNQSGAYKLTVENLVAQAGMGCNANPTSPDAVYRFHLSADTRVQIDTSGSQTSGSNPVPTDTVIGLYDVTASYFGSNYAEDKNKAPVGCDDNGADAAKGWSKIVADLAGNRDYYVVVKSKTSGWGTSQLPYVVNVRDLSANQPIACADVNSSLLVTRSLPAGDYRVVVSNSTGATGGAPFDVRFRNTSVSNSGATQVACSDTPDELTFSAAARTPYYLIVKGDAATDRGQYGLVVETTGTGATSMGCGANPAAPDAFFKFNVTKSGPIVIDTDGSTADTVIALYPASAAVFGTNYAQDMYGNTIPCDDNSGGTTGASRIATNLAPGAYYLVVKGKTLSWNQTAQPFNVSIRDSDSTGSIACASASVGGKKLVQSLPAGDYNVVMSTASAGGGAYSVKFRDTAKASAESGTRLACAAGGSVTVSNLAGGHEYFVVVKGNNATDAGGYTLTLEDTVSLAAASGSTSIACAAEGSKIDGMYPAGTYYALVTGDSGTSAGPYTLKAMDVDALADQNRLACNDDGGPNRTSVIEKNLAAGTHYVVVKGKGADQKGAYSLHVRDADAVPSRNLGCGGASNAERLEYDVQAGQDYTVLLKGDGLNEQGKYTLKLYDQYGLQNTNGQRLTCVSDAQPTTLYNSNWHTKAVDFNLSLTPDTYYVSVKGLKAADKGNFQLQLGELSARTAATYTPPSWTEIKDAIAATEVRVLPVIATGGDSSSFVPPAEAQAQTVALTTHAVRQDGTPIWQKIQSDGRGTGSGLITGIAELADYLSLDVSLVAVDGPDPGASRFRIGIAPVNSPSCVHPHPLVDTVTGVCTPKPNDPRGYNCNTQYSCAPGSSPKFTVTFTNPSDAPVPPNPNDPYGGYHFKLQIYGNKKYLLDEVPVYIIPTTHMTMGPPSGGSGMYQSTGTYSQDIDAASCPKLTTGGSVVTNDLPTWSDLFFNADVPEGTSIDFQLCTADTATALSSCVWSDGTAGTRKPITVRSKGTCTDDTQCRNVPSYGNGFCASGKCQFISAPKVAYDVPCTSDSACPNGPLGAGDYVIASRCETTRGAVGYGYCVYTSQPADLGGTLLTGEQGRPYSRIKVTLHSDSTGSVAPTLYQWYLTYFCKSAQ